MPEIKAVIFDLGRVMVRLDTSGEKFGGLMRAVGANPENALGTFWNTEEVRAFMTGGLSSRDFHDAMQRRYGIRHTFPEFAEAWCDLFSPMPGMADLFANVSRRYRVGILSDTDPLHWERIRQVSPCLKTVPSPTLSHLVGYLKPHPGMYGAAVSNAGVSAGECLFVDDLQKNVDGAREAGLEAVRFVGVEELARAFIEKGVAI